MPTDAERRELYGALEQTLGAVPAATLMDLLPPIGWADVARRSDVENLRIEIRGEISELRGDIAKLNARIDGLIPRLMLATLPMIFAVAGLVLAAARLA